MGDDRPIGVFDSGCGGLTVLRELHRTLPGESTIYIADLANFPYGPRPPAQVKRFAFGLIEYLQSQQVKLVVVACNTATAAALDQARERYVVPLVGVVGPGALAAVQATRRKRVAVISTEGTLRSNAYLHAIRELDPTVIVHQKACPELVDLVERGEAGSAHTRRLLARELSEFVRLGADVLVLGCTHYPLLRPAIEAEFGDAFQLIDSAGTTAARVQAVLDHANLLSTGGAGGRRVLVTGDVERFNRVTAGLFGAGAEVGEPLRLWEGAATGARAQ